MLFNIITNFHHRNYCLYKILFLRIRELKEKWDKPIKNFKSIQFQLVELFGDRYEKHINLD